MKNIVRLALVAGWAMAAPAQTITSSLTGVVYDTTGQSIPDAIVTLHNSGTGVATATRTDLGGSFTFSAVQPGTYSITATSAGFRSLEVTGVALTSGERRRVSDLVLQVGTVNESMTVTGEAVAVETESAQRSGLITNRQANDLMLIGRDYLGLVATLPGVVDLTSRDRPGRSLNMSIQGSRPGMANLTLDGAANLNTGSQSSSWVSPSLDSIAEVKVMLNNYEAQYGRNAGASINVITKTGTRSFHGGAYYFKRNEALNANDFFFNQRGVARPKYRYDFSGFNIGGPVYVPGHFNTDKTKLFFFFSQEFTPQRSPNSQNLLTVPTALERQGDFSQSFDQSGRLLVIRDPLTGTAFANNTIPANRVDPNMQRLLGVLPLPNYVDPTRASNYVTIGNMLEQPNWQSLFRVDYNISSKYRMYVRGIKDVQKQRAGYGLPAQGGNWPLIPSEYAAPGDGILLAFQQTLSPTMINEFTFGVTRGVERITPLQASDLTRITRTEVGFNLPQFNPVINDLNLIPNATFGGVPNAANMAIEARFPFAASNNLFDYIDNFTKIAGTHSLRAGIYIGSVKRSGRRGTGTSFNGAFDFSRDTNNPLDSGWAYSNALLGVYRSYSDAIAARRPWANMRFSNIEWYVQDTWKVSRRLTLNYGMRFYIVNPAYERDGIFAAFLPERYDFRKAAVLILPAFNAAGKRSGFDPVTNQFVAPALIGTIAKGDPANGMIANYLDPNLPKGLMDNRGVQYAPRFGFAFDPKADGRTAIRGGFGMTYDRVDGTNITFATNPPILSSPTRLNGLVSETQSAGFLSPTPVSGQLMSGLIPYLMSFSFGVQREVGHGTIVDAAYVGSLGRHLRQTVNLNSVPLGANFLGANQDPTSPGKPLAVNFLRPFPGLGDITFDTFDSSSNYHSLQVQVHRRFGKNLEFSGTWTWSKTMTTSDGGGVSIYMNQKSRYYGRSSYDRTHVVNINWMYSLPRASSLCNNLVIRRVFDDWQFSGIASFISGAPLGIGLATTDGADITGSPTESARVNTIASPELAKGDRTMLRFFNTAAFGRPARGTIGTSARDVLRGPGINNWDMALYKNIRVTESSRFQLRWETYNSFNHTQWASLDTTARFDPAGAQVNGRFGQVISARNPRRMQLALRFIF